ncbi:MAG: pyridoxamine 5'-phosphate oxidase [Pseudomonadales bacterium]
MVLENARREYSYARLVGESVSENPFDQFRLWMDQAIESDISDPTAMCVATAGENGRPWQRMVLLKSFDECGFVFYTNLASRKARDIAANRGVSLHFPWLKLDRQVIIGGHAEKLSRTEVLRYFLKRPKESQLAAWASRQSNRINTRQALETQFIQMREKFSKGEVPVPSFWGGYRVVPEEFEFWQGGENRLHDRFQFLLQENEWISSRLAP